MPDHNAKKHIEEHFPINEQTRRNNPHIFGDSPTATVTAAPPPKMLRQSKDSVFDSKLEEQFFEYIKRMHPGYMPVRPKAKTFRLANGLRYTPDFSASRWPDDDTQGTPRETCWEVKGFMRDDAAAKIKMAAELYPEIRWVLVWKKTGRWFSQTIIPTPGLS